MAPGDFEGVGKVGSTNDEESTRGSRCPRVKWCLLVGTTSLMWETADWCLIAFYWLLRIGKYTMKGSRNATNQTIQFKIEDVTFFNELEDGKITKLPWSACLHRMIRLWPQRVPL